MRYGLSRLTLATLACLGAFAAGCESPPVGPSLANVTVTGVGLRATVGDAALCCCRAIGTATNRNTVPVHVSVKFAGYDGRSAEPLSTIFYFIKDLQPGASHAIDAPGFVVPCSAITDVKVEVDVKGISYPPL
jgi:hypothetical protein